MKLSIIIPYYNTKQYTDELLDHLKPQINDDVEVILVDDGSKEPYKTKHKWCKVIHKKNGGCASARNVGIENSSGEYITFFDSDDLVPNYYVKKIFEKIDEKPDLIEFSWRSVDCITHNHILKSDKDRLKNPSVCTRVFSRAYIGDTRFNEKKDSTEDEDFSRKLGYLRDKNIKVAIITDYMYFYRSSVENSKIKRFKKGLMKTKRVVYYYNRVTSEMTWLLDEIKKEDELNEVWLLTNECQIPELYRYCQITKPIQIWGHYIKGEKYDKIECIEMPLSVDIAIYCEYANMVGGISTFIYNFCQNMKDYSIIFVYDRMDDMQLKRLMKIVPVVKSNRQIICDTVICNRITDEIPTNIKYKQSVQMLHCCHQNKFKIPQGRDIYINVSKVAKDTWKEDCKMGKVIHNMPWKDEKLLLVSATRIGASDKGSNDRRMKILAERLVECGVPYVWLNFSDKPLLGLPKNFVNVPATIDTQTIISRADYLIQLSDEEAYSMSILEALSNNVPVLCTPFPSAYEEGVVDGVNGYVIPFDMNFDYRKILNVPKFKYKPETEKIKLQWREVVGEPKVKSNNVMLRVIREYFDQQINSQLKVGTEFLVDECRANILVKKELCVKI